MGPMFLEVVTVVLLVAVLVLTGVVWWLVRARDVFLRRAYSDAESSAERRFGLWKEQEFSAQRSQLLEVARGEAAVRLGFRKGGFEAGVWPGRGVWGPR